MNEPFTITLKNDYAFKRVFGVEENKAILQDFLECVLDIPSDDINTLELLNKELGKDILDDKTGILDVKLCLKDNTVIDIEIQNSWNAEFVPRTLFYWSKMYIENFKEGTPYTRLHKCITINLIAEGFNLNSDVHSVYAILERKEHLKLTDLLEIHFLNLSMAHTLKVHNTMTDKRSRLINWLKFIETDSKEERTMLASLSTIIQKANEVVDVMSLSPIERQRYHARMKLKSDIVTISETQFNAGMEQGARKKAVETAKYLISIGLSIDDIERATGLSKVEVEKL